MSWKCGASLAFLMILATPSYLAGHHHHGYGHHGKCDSGCRGAGCGSAASANPSNTRHDGRIAEIIYLPAATPEAAMVEVRLATGGGTVLVRLGPTGFLKQSGFALKEGDTIAVTGYWVAGAEKTLVATQLTGDGKSARLRDSSGRPVW